MRNRPFKLPPLNFIEGFEAAARHLSFTKAAAELFLTQSAVSRQIKALEDQLGVQLFERRTRALSLTPEGEALFQMWRTCCGGSRKQRNVYKVARRNARSPSRPPLRSRRFG